MKALYSFLFALFMLCAIALLFPAAGTVLQNPIPGRAQQAYGSAGRMFGSCGTGLLSSTNINCAGFLGVATDEGTSAVFTNDNTTFARQYVIMTTKSSSPTSSDDAGRIASAVFTKNNYLPHTEFFVATPATITSYRVWVGWTSATMSETAGNTTNASIKIIAFSFDTGASDTTINLVTCDGSGGANTCGRTDTTLTFTASHEYALILDMPTDTTSVNYMVSDLTAGTTKTGSRSATMPATATNLLWENVCSTLTSAQRALWTRGLNHDAQ